MHALVLTLDYEMYSWGEGSKGTLGFGNRENVLYPEKLEILDYNGWVYKILQITCGNFHSMCLTDRSTVFSWGDSSFGRLGLGEEFNFA